MKVSRPASALALVIALASAVSASTSLAQQLLSCGVYEDGVEYLGNDVRPPLITAGQAACCDACAADAACAFFTYEGGARASCHLKNANAPDHSRRNASVVSGHTGADPPTPAPAGPAYSVRARGRLSTTADAYVCWNVDASANRGFFWRNLSTAAAYGAKLARQASSFARGQAGGASLLRFGGTGNDFLTYEAGGFACPPESEYRRCLNLTTWRELLGFTAAARARMILGLSMNTGLDAERTAGGAGARGPFPFPWDPANARALLSWTIGAGLDHLLAGLELGNEQNTKYTPAQMATNFAVLHNLTVELWPDAARRPPLYGPDPHGLHATGGASLDWLVAWLAACRAAAVPIAGVTHHEYIEVNPTEDGFVAPTRLALSGRLGAEVVAAVRRVDPDVAVWAGEIGPHNGGSPPCDRSSMRWAVYGDSLWYADALGAKAAAGYAGFCRQDYIGADYGLLDCSTGTPLPDFYTALVWTHVMGPIVLRAELRDSGGHALGDDAVVRAAVHCVARGEGANGRVAVLAINLSNRSTTLHFDRASLGELRRAYVLEPSDDPAASLTNATGLLGTGVRLNGELLRTAADGHVPRPAAQPVSGDKAALPAHAIAFFVLAAGGAPCP